MKKSVSSVLSIVLIFVFAFFAIASGAKKEDMVPNIDETIQATIQDEFDGIIDENYGEDEVKATENQTYPDNMEYRNALKSAESYLEFSSFSRQGLIEQLEYEQYSNEAAVYAVDNVGADWNEQALGSALSYLDFSAFSREGLIEQLEYEGFTAEEAKYGVDNCGADWFEQAAKSAESYLEFSSFSKSGLIDQLEFEGFTHEQAVYGAEQNGY